MNNIISKRQIDSQVLFSMMLMFCRLPGTSVLWTGFFICLLYDNHFHEPESHIHTSSRMKYRHFPYFHG